MPCRCDDDYGVGDEEKLRRDVDTLTRMLCNSNRVIDVLMEGRAHSDFRDYESREWWRRHQEADTKREIKQ